MKRLLLILTTALVLLALSAGALAEEAVATEADAVRLATETVRSIVSLTDEQWAAVSAYAAREELEGHSGTVWTVTFALNMDMSASYLYAVTLEPRSGQTLKADVSDTAYADAQRANEGYHVLAEWEKEKGSMYYWPQQDVVDYFNLYGDGGYRMPGEGDLTRDEVIAIAKKYAIEQWGMTDEYLSGLPVCTNLTSGEDSYWYVYFVDESIRSSYDDIVAPHMVLVGNPGGEVLGGEEGDTNGVG